MNNSIRKTKIKEFQETIKDSEELINKTLEKIGITKEQFLLLQNNKINTH
jgi:uncharacterized protein YjgD (DUF1641 family)